MLNSSIRCCLRMQRTIEISCLSSNRLVFSPVRVNPSVRCLSLSSGKLSDTSDLDKLISGSDKKSEIELLFQDKAPTPTSPTEVVEVDSGVFTDGASSLLSSAPVDPLLSLAEPTFTSLGLAHMWPSGWLQAFLETLHIDLGNNKNILLASPCPKPQIQIPNSNQFCFCAIYQERRTAIDPRSKFKLILTQSFTQGYPGGRLLE